MNKTLRIVQVLLVAFFLFAGFTPGAIFGATEGEASMATVSVRYIVDDVQAAVAFYTSTWASASSSIPLPASPCSREAACACC